MITTVRASVNRKWKKLFLLGKDSENLGNTARSDSIVLSIVLFRVTRHS